MDLFGMRDREPGRLLAVTERGEQLRYGDALRAAAALEQAGCRGRLVFLLCKNDPGTLLGYLGCLLCGAVPLLLDAKIDAGLLARLSEVYRPAFYYGPGEVLKGWEGNTPVLELSGGLLRSGGTDGPALHPDLALLLTTSGSTGSPKLVRLSGNNLRSNAASIAEYLELDETERPITALPMSYSYGMSIVNSHVLAGAALLLTERTLVEKEFWAMVKEMDATSLSGVPYTYQMYKRLGLMKMDLPALRYLTQAGGKLPAELQEEFARWAAGAHKRFYVMYGQTEASPRMSYLPPDRALDKRGSIGIPVPGGRIRLLDPEGAEIHTPLTTGELVYEGENVAMGYAECAADLSRGDDWRGVLSTGDMAQRDAEGFYYIVGRKKRFVKLFGNRVNLDEIEQGLVAQYPAAGFACVGRDDLISIYTDSAAPELQSEIPHHLSAKYRFPLRAFRVCCLPELPKSASGKLLYAQLPTD